MSQDDFSPTSEDRVVVEVNRHQIQHFTEADARCRALELPEGIMLRYNLTESLFFYLKTGVQNGAIITRAFASDTPYERQKTPIGEVRTPMFEAGADRVHLEKVEQLLYSWVEFVKHDHDD